MTKKLSVAEQALLGAKLFGKSLADPKGAATDLAALAGVDLSPLFQRPAPAPATPPASPGAAPVIDAEFEEDDEP